MKPIEQAFLDSILESPDDDFPRLVYADWLEENGQAERAEFIRVQCELANWKKECHCWRFERMTDNPNPQCANCFDRGKLCRRKRELLNGVCGLGVEALPIVEGLTRSNLVGRGGYGWYPRNGPNPGAGIESVFRRGFVEEVALPLADWLRHGPALVKAAPLRVVRLSDLQPSGLEPIPGERLWTYFDPWLNGQPFSTEFYSALATYHCTEADALAAMSRCCLEYAHGQNIEAVHT